MTVRRILAICAMVGLAATAAMAGTVEEVAQEAAASSGGTSR